MYTIILGMDGLYHCWGKLQDSTERWTETSLDAAVKSMKDFAKHGNHTKIKKKDIRILREVPTTGTEFVPLKAF